MNVIVDQQTRVLCVYAAGQTYTSTVFEHVDAFRKYSSLKWSFLDFSHLTDPELNFDDFDVVVVHYTVRLPFGQLNEAAAKRLREASALKVLFIQDEYDNTNIAKQVMKDADIRLVFSVVPSRSMEIVYPSQEFPGVRFVSNLTGYVPDNLQALVGDMVPPSQRSLLIAYRGRPLPLRYGRLGMEKVEIGSRVKAYCEAQGLAHDIAWSEESRIYGDDWYRFISSSRAMLGSESGSNVFDWDGTLHARTEEYKSQNRDAPLDEIYANVVASCEVDGLMNQLSPRIFEMAASRTAMVLFEGNYSGVLVPYRHFLPLRKDFSNLPDVFKFLDNGQEVDLMTDRAFEDVIGSGNYSYKQFVEMVDAEIKSNLQTIANLRSNGGSECAFRHLSAEPTKSKPPVPQFLARWPSGLKYWIARLLYATWSKVPMWIRPFLKRILGRA